MTLVSFLGNVGSGKTLGSTIFGCYDSRPIYSNYEIHLAKWTRLQPEMLVKDIDSALIIIDEFWAWVESRRSGLPINIYMSQVLFQSRKRGMDIIITDQIAGVIDLRYRQMIDYTIVCENIKDVGFGYHIFEKTINGIAHKSDIVIPYEIAEYFYPVYDTYEIVNPLDTELLHKVSVDKTDTIALVDKITNELLSKADAKRITKGVVADYCLRNKHDRYLVNLVYDSVKSRMVLDI